jgi:hypothetical protein
MRNTIVILVVGLTSHQTGSASGSEERLSGFRLE